MGGSRLFSFRVFFEVSEYVSTASGDVDCSVRGIFHILIFQISNLFFCEEIVLPMMAFSIFSFEFQLQCRDFCRAVRYHTLSAATRVFSFLSFLRSPSRSDACSKSISRSHLVGK